MYNTTIHCLNCALTVMMPLNLTVPSKGLDLLFDRLISMLIDKTLFLFLL